MPVSAEVVRRVRALSSEPKPSDDATRALLQGAWETARARCPEARVSEERFAVYLADRLAPQTDCAQDFAARALGDLFLACACFDGDALALATLESSVMPKAEGALARLGATPDEKDELKQRARERLFVGGDDGPRIAQYGGDGSLARWLSVVFVRELLMMRRGRHARETPLTDVEHFVEAGVAVDPELELLRRTYGDALREAFRCAFGSLTAPERNILRYHTIDRLTIDDLATLLGVGRSTAARWIVQAREALATKTRAELKSRLHVATETLQSILGLVESEAHVHVHGILGAEPSVE